MRNVLTRDRIALDLDLKVFFRLKRKTEPKQTQRCSPSRLRKLMIYPRLIRSTRVMSIAWPPP